MTLSQMNDITRKYYDKLVAAVEADKAKAEKERIERLEKEKEVAKSEK